MSDPNDRLIAPHSILRAPPVELDEEAARLVTGIRLNAQALEAAWVRLWESISAITAEGAGQGDHIAAAVISAWQVVDSFHLIRCFADQFNRGQASPTLGPYQEEFRQLRDDHQHRLQRAVTKANRGGPHLGALHWVHLHDSHSGIGYTAWIGARPGLRVSEMNPFGRMKHDRPGVQGVELESFSGIARVQEGVVAVIRFVRGLEQLLEQKLGHLDRGPGDVVLSAEFEFGRSLDEVSPPEER